MDGQTRRYFNLNAENGLPSNHVYGVITDRLGYLWVATDKGVVRYNGYECKLFDMSNGLPTNDIWQLVEDRTGKIWLGCSSDEIGFIENDKYHKAYFSNSDHTFSPTSINAYEDGIIFTSRHLSGNNMPSICVARGDTVFQFDLSEDLFNISDTLWNIPDVFCTQVGSVFIYYKRRIFRLNNISGIYENKTAPNVTLLENFDKDFLSNNMTEDRVFAIGNNFFSFSRRGNKSIFKRVSFDNIMTDSVDIKEFGVTEPINYINYDGQSSNRATVLNVYTQRHILRFSISNGLRHLETYDLGPVLDSIADNTQLIACLKDETWGGVFGTTTNGIFIETNNYDQRLSKSRMDLRGYKPVGKGEGDVLYWWNTDSKKMLKVSSGKVVATFGFPELENIYKVIWVGRDSLQFIGNENFYFNERNAKLTWIRRGLIGTNVMDVLYLKSDLRFVLAKMAVYYIGREHNFDSINPTFIDLDRYRGVVFDTLRQKLWVYNHRKMMLLDPFSKNEKEKQFVRDKRLKGIEEVVIDRHFGNVFIRLVNSLVVYDPEQGEVKPLLEGFNFTDAHIAVQNNILVAAGNFGIVVCRILGKGDISVPEVVFNARRSLFPRSVDIAIAGSDLVVSSGGAVYYFSLTGAGPAQDLNNMGCMSAKVVARCHNIVKGLGDSTLLKIDQNDRKILFDVVKPSAVGRVVYRYRYTQNGPWLELNSNELNIPVSCLPDHYYRVYLYVGDDAWNSSVKTLNIYVRPYWWQTRFARLMIKVGAILLGLIIVGFVIIVTRKLVMRASLRKQSQMELELKAIYSQINPHFIFNSLNSALLLVSKNKMDEAYVHISKFSRLLRSYLRSSRNKYVTIEEEVANLNNYVELQQARFKSRFTYEVDVDPAIDAARTKIPSLLIQPFVENAINHGILPMTGAGIIVVRFLKSLKESSIVCVIDDNGIGREQSRRNNAGAEEVKDSYGDVMIRDLVAVFNRYEKMNIFIDYYDKKAPQNGTTVTITIKNPNYEP